MAISALPRSETAFAFLADGRSSLPTPQFIITHPLPLHFTPICRWNVSASCRSIEAEARRMIREAVRRIFAEWHEALRKFGLAGAPAREYEAAFMTDQTELALTL